MSMYTESLRAFLKPVLAYLDDEAVSEIMINGPEDVWVEKKGRLFKTEAKFSEEGLLGAARNMAQFVGRTLSDERPRLDARLPDGSRIHVVMPPIARRGCTISIRKFFKDKPTVETLLKYGSLTPPMTRVVEAAIRAKLNVVVAGGTGSGKTTLLNILSSLIPNDERILTIEDSAELQLTQDHLVSFESRPPDKLGKGGVDMGDLLHSALRLRPDRIIVGEVRGGEAFHLMQAMNTGHGGSMATCHANTPTDTLRRLESLCLMSAVEMPMVAIRAQVASAIHLIVCCERMQDGSRKVTHISEVLPLNEKGEYRTQDLFVYTPIAKDEQGRILGYHAPTGIIPSFSAKARAYGFPDLDERFFDPATYGVPAPPLFHLGEDYTVRWAPSLKHRQKNLPDPEEWKDQLAAFERKLKDEAGQEARRVGGPSPVPTTDRTPSPERAAPERAAPERAAPERMTSERMASERAAPERAAPERMTSERMASERVSPPASERTPAPTADRMTPPSGTAPRRAPPGAPPAAGRPVRASQLPPGLRNTLTDPGGPPKAPMDEDDDKTPPPTRNPLPMEDLDAALGPPPRRDDARMSDSKVEVASDLLSDGDGEDAPPPPPRRGALPPQRTGTAGGIRAVSPSPSQVRSAVRPPPPPPPPPDEDEDEEPDDAEASDPDKTRIKAPPTERPRR